jgi:Domain of unknown function (DUF3427).
LPEKNLDVFFVTLNKSEKDYSPSMMYQDYSINEELFHWQSYSRTTEESVTGQRYLNQAVNGGNVWFFVREYKKEALWPHLLPVSVLRTCKVTMALLQSVLFGRSPCRGSCCGRRLRFKVGKKKSERASSPPLTRKLLALF